MQAMSHNPAATAIGTGIVDHANMGLMACDAAAPAITTVAPAGADEVSAQAAASFAAEGAAALAVISSAYDELVRTGMAVMDITDLYSTVDAGAAGTLA